MAHNEPTTFEGFRDELARLLNLAIERGLSTIARDALRMAVLKRVGARDLAELEGYRRSLTPAGVDLANRISGLLADADIEVPERVAELEAMVGERLAVPSKLPQP